jgi:AcrR family transcriptional regulator
MDAVYSLLEDTHPAALSIPAVSKRSGVSLATIYRHYPSKELLLEAAASGVDRHTRDWLGEEPVVAGKNLEEFVSRMWHELAGQIPAIRISHSTPGGHEFRALRQVRREQDAVRGIEASGVDAGSDAGRRLVRLVLLLLSSSTLIEQVDRMGQDVDEAAGDIVWAIETLVGAVAALQQRSSS